MNLLTYDITNFVNEFLVLIIDIFSRCYSILDSITFNGISLLQYIITILVLSAVLSILFTLISTDINVSHKEKYIPRHSSDNKMVAAHGRRHQSRS